MFEQYDVVAAVRILESNHRWDESDPLFPAGNTDTPEYINFVRRVWAETMDGDAFPMKPPVVAEFLNFDVSAWDVSKVYGHGEESSTMTSGLQSELLKTIKDEKHRYNLTLKVLSVELLTLALGEFVESVKRAIQTKGEHPYVASIVYTFNNEEDVKTIVDSFAERVDTSSNARIIDIETSTTTVYLRLVQTLPTRYASIIKTWEVNPLQQDNMELKTS